jgi:hypothetical protein
MLFFEIRYGLITTMRVILFKTARHQKAIRTGFRMTSQVTVNKNKNYAKRRLEKYSSQTE